MSSYSVLKLLGRLALFAGGMFVMSFGIALVANTNLGNTPISSLPYTIADLTGLTFGGATFAMNVVLVALQAILLRRRFRLFQLLQIPAVFVFSAFIDLSMWIQQGWQTPFYPLRVLGVIVGSLLLAAGIMMQLQAHIVVQPGEGFVLAVSAVTGRPFPLLKVANDVTLVILACLTGLAFAGTTIGVREGTVASAFLVGWFLKLISLAMAGGSRSMKL